MQIRTFRYIFTIFRTNNKLTYEVYIIAPEKYIREGFSFDLRVFYHGFKTKIKPQICGGKNKLIKRIYYIRKLK